MTTSPPTESKQFRSSVLSLFIFIVALSAPVVFCTAVSLCSYATHGIRVSGVLDRILALFAGMFAFHAILALLGACLLSRFCPTTISVDGVTTQSFTGGRRFVRWQDITKARTFRFLNLKWILVYPVGQSKALQLPLFQPRKAEFRQEIQRFAPPANPILNHL